VRARGPSPARIVSVARRTVVDVFVWVCICVCMQWAANKERQRQKLTARGAMSGSDNILSHGVGDVEDAGVVLARALSRRWGRRS
jgi:hypothetical protein